MDLALVLGNTRLRFGLLDEGAGDIVVASGAFPWAALEGTGFRELREIVERHRPGAVLVGSVRADRLPAVLEHLAGARAVTVAGRDFPVPVKNRYHRPAEAGVDRLLNVLAAGRLWPGASVVVVDLGTALSVSAGSPSGAFLGGVIGAGLGAAAASLCQAAPALPPPGPPAAWRRPGGVLQRSTLEGLRAGLYWQFAGGVQRIIDGLRGELEPPVRVVATGGDAPILVPALAGVDALDLDLALKGLGLAARARS